jgi:hypothetical protein
VKILKVDVKVYYAEPFCVCMSAFCTEKKLIVKKKSGNKYSRMEGGRDAYVCAGRKRMFFFLRGLLLTAVASCSCVHTS